MSNSSSPASSQNVPGDEDLVLDDIFPANNQAMMLRVLFFFFFVRFLIYLMVRNVSMDQSKNVRISMIRMIMMMKYIQIQVQNPI